MSDEDLRRDREQNADDPLTEEERTFGRQGMEEPQDLATEWAMRRGCSGCGLVLLLLFVIMVVSMCVGPTRPKLF